MTPERWQQVKHLFNSALDHESEERTVFLERACDGDEGLRGEVQSLLDSFSGSETFMETPVARVAAELLSNDQADSLVGARLGHYDVISLLGQGGMGTVYLARDSKLGRKVAFKLLPNHFTCDENRLHRFEQEARAASALNHPNIITIHEIGESDAGHYLVTEFVEGETIRDRLIQERLDLPTALEVVTQVASALVAAHEAQIIHRDIKPENLMLRRDGLVKVLDFGLAKLTESPISAPKTESQTAIKRVDTEMGLIMGSIGYMSPEQARAQKVDARTDIFSLGVVLYEMVSGRAPFEGESVSDVLAAILKTEAPPLADVVHVPSELERIVYKCLEKDRERRYSSANELLIDLKNLTQDLQVPPVTTVVTKPARHRRPIMPRAAVAISTVMILIVTAALVYPLLFGVSPAPVTREIKSLAVLPLQNLSGDPAQDYFADGMTEALISNLARISALRVISRTSAMRYQGSNKSLPEIARELNVDAVIEGSVQRSGGRVRVTAQLIHAATDAHLWAREYERDLTDVLKLQSEVARAVADEIRIQVTPEERARLASARSVIPQAHEAYLLGRYHLNKSNEQNWKQAIEYFERAIQFDPDYGAAFAGLSDAWLQRGILGANFKEVESHSRASALKAIELDEQLAEAHTSLANIKGAYDWDWAGAEQESRRALELDPGSLHAHINYGHLLMALGRHDEAIREGQSALQLDPLSSATQSALGRFLYRARRYEEAVPHLMRAIELEPQNVGANFRLGELYVQLGKYDEAIAAFKKVAIATFGEVGGRSVGIARVYALMGRKREARQVIKELKAPAISMAAVYVALDDKDEAFRVLEKAVEERSSYLVYFKEDPPLESLHSDPRWKELLRRMNFPPD